MGNLNQAHFRPGRGRKEQGRNALIRFNYYFVIHCGPSFCVVGRCCLWGFFSVNWYYVNQFLGKILNSLRSLFELFHQTEPDEIP